MSRPALAARATRAARHFLHAIPAGLCVVLSACGGGDSGDGGKPRIVPVITGSLLAFKPGEAPAGSELGGHNALALVKVLDPQGGLIDDVTITLNDTVLTYDPSQGGYAAPLTVEQGRNVRLAVHIGEHSYLASATLPTHAPEITTPLENQGWDAYAINGMQWNVTTQPQSVQYLGVLSMDSGRRVAPILELAAGTRSYDFQARYFQSGDYTLLVGAGDPVAVPDAQPGSGFVVGLVGKRNVRARYGVTNITGMSLSGIPTPALLLKSASQALRAGALTGSSYPSSDVTIISQWQSSDPAVVSVTHDGVITAVSAGVANISATYRGHAATLQVRVIDPGPWSGDSTRTQSVTYQVDYGHSGHVTLGGSQPALPLQGRWTKDLGGEVIYPLVAGGRVFVMARGPGLGTGANLRALDVGTGELLWGPIHIPGTLNVAYHAYDDGRVFVAGVDGVLQAFNAQSGTKLWETDLQDFFDIESPPVAVNGLIHVLAHNGSSTLFTVDQDLGQVLWKSSAASGIRGSPAVDSDGVYLTNQGRVYKFDRLTGQLHWSTQGLHGQDTTPVKAAGRLFIRFASSPLMTNTSPNATMNPSSGTVLGTFPGLGMPAVAGGYSYHVVDGGLVSVSISTQQQRWTFNGDGQLVGHPLVIDDHVVVASRTGKVFMLDAGTGAEVWSGDTPPPGEIWDEHRASMGVGDGYLLVPGGTTITGWKLLP